MTLTDTRPSSTRWSVLRQQSGYRRPRHVQDSNWLMSVVLAHQPHFADQPADVRCSGDMPCIPDRVGDFVAKPMSDCSGAEILHELCGHLNFDAAVFKLPIAFPAACPISPACSCRVRQVTVRYRFPNRRRIWPSSASSSNPRGRRLHGEYSVRVAQMAVYQLLNIHLEVPPILHHDRSLEVNYEAVIKAFKWILK